MIWTALESFWHFIFGWPTVDVLIGSAAVTVAVLEPPLLAKFIPELRRAAICTAVVAFTFLSISGKFYNDGLAEKQRQWDAALVKETGNGETAWSDAVATVQRSTPDSVRNDGWNRDNWKRPSSK